MTDSEREQTPAQVAEPDRTDARPEPEPEGVRPLAAPGGASCAALDELDVALGELLAGLEALRAAFATATASRGRGTPPS